MNTLSLSLSVHLVSFSTFFMPSCESQTHCSSCSLKKGGNTFCYVWHHLCFYRVWISNHTHTHPSFFYQCSPTAAASPTPHPPHDHLHFLRYNPFQLLSPVRLPLPPPPPPCFVFLLYSFPLYKVFEIYHLYIMMYGYDNVLYYGKMRKIYFCYWFVS